VGLAANYANRQPRFLEADLPSGILLLKLTCFIKVIIRRVYLR